MKWFTLLSLLLFLLVGCTTPAAEPTPTLAPKASNTPHPTTTTTETATPKPSETATATEVIRFSELKPPTIEDVMKYNQIDFSSTEKMVSERALLKAQELVNMPTNPADCPSYIIQPFRNSSGDINDYRLIIKNPKVSSVTISKIGDKEFIHFGFYTQSRDGTYCEPMNFSFDLDLNRNIPPYMTPDQESFDKYYSLFANDEANYKALIEGKVKEIDIGAIFNIYGVNPDSVQKNLLWLFNQNISISSDYYKFANVLTWPQPTTQGMTEERAGWWKNCVNFLSDYFMPATVMVINK